MQAYVPVVVVVYTAACSAAVNAQPSIVELPGVALDVSDDGMVVTGRMSVPSAPFHAYRWTTDGGVQDLGTLGGSMSIGLGASGDGSVIAGWSSTSTIQRAFRWTAAGGMQDVGAFDEGSSIANAISADATTIVGTSSSRAFRWTATGGIEALGATNGNTSWASDVNADGSVVVGGGSDGAFRWTGGEGMQSLGVLIPGGSSQAHAVSADGEVVAGYADGNETGLFRWTTSSGIQEIGRNELGWLDLEVTIGDLSMSGDGLVMGGSGVDFSSGEMRNRAWLWTQSAGLMHLDTYLLGLGLDLPGWELHEVTGLSFDGSTIVGIGMYDGESRSWMVTGVPSPGGLALMALCGVISARRRRVK